MIIKAPSYYTSDGTTHADLETAKKHELMELLEPVGKDGTDVVVRLLEHAETVASILVSTGRKPRERKRKIGRPKGSKTKTAPEPSYAPLQESVP